MGEGHDVVGERLEEGLSAADIIVFLRAQSLLIVALVLVGAIVGGVLSYSRPREWEATSVLRIGQIDDGAVTPRLLEPTIVAAQRVQLQPFADQVLQNLSLPMTGDPRDAVIRATLSGEAVPTTDLVKLSVRDISPEFARAAMQAAQTQLLAIHESLYQIGLKQLKERLDSINADIASVQSRHGQMAYSNVPDANANGGSPVVTNALLNNMFNQSTNEFVDRLRERQSKLILQLSADHTYSTTALSAIAVSRQPVSPGPLRPAILGAVVGLLIGLLVGAGRHARRCRSE